MISVLSGAQSFYDSTYTHIPDTNKVCILINISGLPTKIDTDFGLDSVCLNITHTFDQDLVIHLISPDGSVITLAGGVGNHGHDFINTCFAENGASGLIASGSAPFTGTFIPQQSLNLLNNGQNPNGTWKLCISDTYFADTGSYHNSKITFSANPPPTPPPPPVICTYCTCPNAKDTCDLLPDIITSALCIQNHHTEYHDSIKIANSTANIGRGPMEIHGIDTCFCDTVPVPCSTICPPGKELNHLVTQRIYQRHGTDSLSYYDRVAGKMSFHPTHHHIHLDYWGDYSLRLQTPDPNPTTWPVVGFSTKQSFCLMNYSNCTDSLGFCQDSAGNTITMNDIPNAGFGLYSGCGLDQGIYPGYLDIYIEYLNDPIILNNICDGTYYIVSIVDPKNNFLESNETNNWASVPITLTKQGTPSGVSSFNYALNGLQASFTNTSPAGSYLWNFGDGSWDTLYNPIHTYTAAGTYTISLVSRNQCYGMGTQVITITGINEYNHQDLNLHTYQNPITENSFITYFLPQRTNVKIEIIDMLGKEVTLLVSEKQQPGLQKYPLSDLALSPGAYLLKLTAEGLGINAVKLIRTK